MRRPQHRAAAMRWLVPLLLTLGPVGARADEPPTTATPPAVVAGPTLLAWEPSIAELVAHLAVQGPATPPLRSGASALLPSDIAVSWSRRFEDGADSARSISDSFDETRTQDESDHKWDEGHDESTTTYLTLRVDWEPAHWWELRGREAADQRDEVRERAEARAEAAELVCKLYEARREAQAELMAGTLRPGEVWVRVARIEVVNERLSELTGGWWRETLRTRIPFGFPRWLAGLGAD